MPDPNAQHREEPKSARVGTIGIMIAFIVVALLIALYWFVFHGSKNTHPEVAPSTWLSIYPNTIYVLPNC